MMRKCHVRFGGGPGEKAVMTSLAVYPTFAALRSGFRQQLQAGVRPQLLKLTVRRKQHDAKFGFDRRTKRE